MSKEMTDMEYPSPQQHVTGDNQPRYTTKRLHDEIAKAKDFARREALENAAAAVDDRRAAYDGEYEELKDGPAKSAYLAASNALFVAAQNIRSLSTTPAPEHQTLVDQARVSGFAEGIERAAKIADEHAADFERQADGKEDPHAHDALLLAADACELTADAIRSIM